MLFRLRSLWINSIKPRFQPFDMPCKYCRIRIKGNRGNIQWKIAKHVTTPMHKANSGGRATLW